MFEWAHWPMAFAWFLPLLVRLIKPWLRPQASAIVWPTDDLLWSQTPVTKKNAFKLPSFHQILFWLSWTFFILALMQPLWVGTSKVLPTQSRQFMIALDLSDSMNEEDMPLENRYISRLDATKLVLEEFIKERKGDALGLVLFGTHPHFMVPMTLDHSTFIHFLHRSETGLAGPRTAIGDAIALSLQKLKDLPSSAPKIIILITDGRNTAGQLDPLEAARWASEQGVQIYTIGVGGGQSFAIQGLLGLLPLPFVQSDLDEELLKTIASLTKGAYFKAENTETLMQIYQTLDQLEPAHQLGPRSRPEISLFHFPLSVSVLLLLCAWLLCIRRTHHTIKHHG
jgi:Ca-activated chloride channel family protein